jgi:hypothetical protein
LLSNHFYESAVEKVKKQEEKRLFGRKKFVAKEIRCTNLESQNLLYGQTWPLELHGQGTKPQ